MSPDTIYHVFYQAIFEEILAGEEMSLNIFEPRYRLLIRRCLEGSRKFGMTTVNRAHELSNIACEVEIQECRAAPDGRFLIDIVGTQRFRVARSWEQVGGCIQRIYYP